jgi:long-chain acyl-CoA synthetase
VGDDPVGLDRRPRSLAHLFWDHVDVMPDSVAYYYPVEGGWQESSWGQTAGLVEGLAAGLVALGIGVEDRVAIVSTTRYEWILAALAAWSAAAAVTTVRPGTGDDHMAHVLSDSGARLVIAEDHDEVHRLWRIRARIRGVTKVVQIEGDYPDPRVLSLEGLLRTGHDHLAEHPRAIAQRRYAVRREGLAAVLYSGGSDGRPRGVRLRHSALAYQGMAAKALGVLDENDLMYLGLPLAHSFGQSLLAVQLACGFPAAVDGDPDRLLDSLYVVRPTFLGATPRMLTQVRAAVSRAQSGRLARRHRSQDGSRLAAIRDAFGDRLRFVVAGAAGLDADLAEFFELAGVEVLAAYGLAEAGGAVCVDLPGDRRQGTVGRPLPGTRVRIDDNGEVLVAGPGVMDGYHERRLDTDAVLRQGWLSTGDLGVIELDGRLRILTRRTGRPAP